MRMLSYFGGRMLDSRGTPSRARNLTQSLASIPGIELLALTGDRSSEAKEALNVEQMTVPSVSERRACLLRAVEQFKPDIIYGHTHKAMIEMIDPRLEHVKRVVDLHGDTATERWESTDRTLLRRLAGFARARLTEARSLPRMDAFTVVSKPLAERVQKAGKPVEVIWGGVDPDLFCSKGPPQGARLRVAYAGNYRSYQGVDVLLEAARRLVGAGEPFEFSFVGDMDRFPDFKRAALEQLGDRMTAYGQIPYRDVPAILSQSHVLVIPRPPHGTVKFGFPSKLAEYLAMGRATIATRVGDMERVIEDGKNGLLVAPGSADELHAALLRLKDAPLRERLAKAGRRHAETHLAWPILANRTEMFLKKIVADGG